MRKQVRLFSYSHIWSGVSCWAIIFAFMSILNLFIKYQDGIIDSAIFLNSILSLCAFIMAQILIFKHKICLKGAYNGVFIYMYDEVVFLPWHYIERVALEKYNTIMFFKDDIANFLKEVKLFKFFQETCDSKKLKCLFYTGGKSVFLKRKYNKLYKAHEEYEFDALLEPHIIKKMHPNMETFLIILIFLLGILFFVKSAM